MKKRISKEAKAIADAHIQARRNNDFTNPEVTTKEELIDKLHEGETFEALLREIEVRFCSVGSVMMSSIMNHTSNNYKAAVYKGFKLLIDTEDSQSSIAN